MSKLNVKNLKYKTALKALILINVFLLLPWPTNILFANESSYRTENNLAASIMGVPGLWSFSQGTSVNGLTGKGQVIAVADSGLDGGRFETIHPDLKDRLLGVKDFSGDGWADPNGHGTHIAGSIVGTGVKSEGIVKGIAPEAGLYFQATYNDKEKTLRIPSVYELLADAYNAPGKPRIHVNSWGASFSDGIYDWDTYSLDKFVWEHPDMVVLKSAGNGFKTSKPYVSSPGAAKNAITVGSTEGTRGVDASSDNPDQVAGFSSRGTFDGRIKPEVLAPGTWILSTRKTKPNLATDSYIGLYNQYYGYMSGTSMSTALTAGSLALLRQYFQAKGVAPSAALLKASLIFGTQKLPGVSSSDQGFGRVNVENTLLAIEKGDLFFQDNPGVPTGQKVTYTYASNGQPFRVVMAYSDYPKTPGIGKDLVNDLDLKVTGPGGKEIYWGNGYLEGDRLNNVEEVIVDEPINGQVYTIEVTAHNILHGPQPFALVFGNMPYSGTVKEINNEEIRFIDGQTFKLSQKALQSATIKDVPPGSEAYLTFGLDGEATHIDAQYMTITSKIMSKEGNKQLTVFDGTRWTLAEEAGIYIGENQLNWSELPIESEVTLTCNPVTARVWRVDIKNLPDNSPYYSLPISDAEVKQAIIDSKTSGKVVLSAQGEVGGDKPITLAFRTSMATEIYNNRKPVELRLPGLTIEIPVSEFSRFGNNQQGAQLQIRVSWQSVGEKSLPSSDPLMYLRTVGRIVEVKPTVVWPDGTQLLVSQAISPAKVTITTPIGSTAGLNIQKLGAYRLNELTRMWEFINNDYNPDSGKSTIVVHRMGTFAVLEASRTFLDIMNHWAKSDIEIMAARHVVRGMTPDTFAPDDMVTRGQFTVMLVRTLGIPEETTGVKFTDLPTDYWCTGAVGAAAKMGLVAGFSDGTFAPNDPITREQMAAMLVRALTLKADKSFKDTGYHLGNFTDIYSISDWARDSVAIISGEGLMNGREKGIFAPRENTTRAEATAVMVRLISSLANSGRR